MEWGTVGALVTSIVSIIIAIMSKRKLTAETRKLNAEANRQEADGAQQLTTAALALVEPLKIRVTECEAEIHKMTTKLDEMEEELIIFKRRCDEYVIAIKKLGHQVKSLGHQPVYEIKDDKRKG